MRTPEFVGNEEALALLSAWVDNDRFPHALLIEGPAGAGKRTLARLLAQAAVCAASGGARPCGVCAACRKAAAGEHPDVELRGGDGARSLSVDVVRDLREAAYVLPNEAPRRVVILAGADTMTVQAQNALLKILEEPPATLLFVLTCENRALLLPTVRSRTVCVTLHGVREEALPLLRARLPEVSEPTLTRALSLYDGCIGRVLAAVQDDALSRVEALAAAIAAVVPAVSEWALLEALAPLDQKDKGLTDDVLAALRLLFRDALAVSQGYTAHPVSSTAQTLAQQIRAPRLAALVDTTAELQQARRRNINQTLLLTWMSAQLRAAAGRD